ncbi:MAG: 2-amino-4-hydroxy-6-hydroxymethyldihydropteridine diphosphokinase [Candidatus Sedimenticola sp. (ex Thyasira tokunagai)]
MKVPVTAYVGLGSNLEDPEAQVNSALNELSAIPLSRCVAHSSLYISSPLGPADQPDYINAVAALETALEPYPLLRALQAIEQRHKRKREKRWGPRTLDLDLLLYGGLILNDTDLKIPHPGIAIRPFVLYPLLEIAPSLELPGLGVIQQLAEACPPEEVKLLHG